MRKYFMGLVLYTILIAALTFLFTKKYYIKEYTYLNLEYILLKEREKLAHSQKNDQEINKYLRKFKERFDHIVAKESKTKIIFIASTPVIGVRNITEEIQHQLGKGDLDE